MAFAFQCPFCGHHSTIGESNKKSGGGSFEHGNKYGPRYVTWEAIVCPNPECLEYTLDVVVQDGVKYGGSTLFQAGQKLQYYWPLVPAARMKVLPDYIPAPIVGDYKEACLIAELSPKASATLSRRCLQGMIRDFWSVKPGRLVDEIKAIRERVDADAWEAIEAVRSVGNIGAHMEADINVIVDVEPDEAKLLIGLIETLVEEWYVTRHDRKTRLGKLADLAKEKLQARKNETVA